MQRHALSPWLLLVRSGKPKRSIGVYHHCAPAATEFERRFSSVAGVAETPARRPPRSKFLKPRLQATAEGVQDATSVPQPPAPAGFTQALDQATASSPSTASSTKDAHVAAVVPSAPVPPAPAGAAAGGSSSSSSAVSRTTEQAIPKPPPAPRGPPPPGPPPASASPVPPAPGLGVGAAPPAVPPPLPQAPPSAPPLRHGAGVGRSLPQPPPASAPLSQATTPLRPLSAEEQYARLRHWLPETKEPQTDRPQPSELTVGTRLRVEWSNAWWKASVKQESEEKVKIAFDTWSSKYDEWIPRDSQRFRLPLPEDADENKPADGFAAVPGLEGLATSTPRDSKPMSPKPFDPEKEFEKRQRRLKAKIAASRAAQGSGGGEESPVAPELPKVPQSPAPQAPLPNVGGIADLTKAHEERQMKLRAKIAGLQQERLGKVDEAVSEKLQKFQGSSAEAPAVAGSAAAAAVQEPPQSSSASTAELASPATAHSASTSSSASSVPSAPLPPPPPGPPTPPPPSKPPAQSSQPSVQAAAPTAPDNAEKAAMQAESIAQPAPQQMSDAPQEPSGGSSTKDAPAPVPPKQTLLKGPKGVRWLELQTDAKEYYYYEVSTGRTQWDLPSLGWVELRDTDGSPYYWSPEDGTTKWDPPVS